MTSQQIQQLASLQTAYNEALSAWQDAANKLEQARQAALSCQSARDQYSLGWKKNQACHIDTLGQLNSAWQAAQDFANTKKLLADSAYNAIANFQRSIDIQIQQQVNELQTDPSFNLQSQQIQANANTATAKAKTEAEAAAKTKRLWIIGGIVLGVLIVGGIIIAVVVSKKDK